MKTVSSGFKSTLDGIGVSYNLEHIDTVDESLVKDNQHKELYVMFYETADAGNTDWRKNTEMFEVIDECTLIHTFRTIIEQEFLFRTWNK